MSESVNKMFDLIDDLSALCDDGIPIFPGRIIVNQKELYKIVNSFPNAISDEINDARIILKKKDEILQQAKLRAESIIQDAHNERSKLLNASRMQKDVEEQAERYKQAVIEECKQIRMVAFNEAQELRLSAKNEAIRLKEASQNYAQETLAKLEQNLNALYQEVMNGQQRLQEMRQNDINQSNVENK